MPDNIQNTASSLKQEEKKEVGLVKKNHLDFLFELYNNNIPLSHGQIQTLVDEGYVDKTKIPQEKSSKKDYYSKRNKVHTSTKILKADPIIVSKDVYETEFVDERDALGRMKKSKRESKRSEIIKSDWMPISLVNHTQDFIDFINSINNIRHADFPKGFKDVRYYKKYDLYKKQAARWYDERGSITDYIDEDERYEYKMREFRRSNENTLYAANKYFYLQDTFSESGKFKFYASDFFEHQRLLFYLFDCGYSLFIGKPRQIGLTSALSIAAMNKCLNRKNYFIKYIAENKEKGEEIFNDKIKFAFYSLDDNWFKPMTNGVPDVLNDRENLFKIGRKDKKGRIAGLNSRIQVVSPVRTAINGGDPPLVFVDETGSIHILTEMINEGRPTMFRKNRDTGEMDIRNQIIMWGTGTTGKGGASLEVEWKRFSGLWDEGEYSSGIIIPIFFHWSTRCDEEEYNKQKKYYYGARSKDEGIDVETSKVQFHQHFPDQPSDMFATTLKLLINRDFIDKNVKKCYTMDALAKPKHGYFKPILDRTKPMPDNFDIPFQIIGAEWIPVDELSDLATSIMFQHPKSNWKYRYYQGTDPISADTGTSRMSSAIWDNYYNTVSCLVNFRKQNDPNYSFLQTLLCGLYYDAVNKMKKGVPELIEKNIGLAYKNYKIERGFGSSLIFNAEIPENLKSGSESDIGIDNKGKRTMAIIHKMYELIDTFGDKIYIPVIFEQLRTFACNTTRTGIEQWGSIDHRYYFDDVLFACAFAYIAGTSSFKSPLCIDDKENATKIIYVDTYDRNWNMIRVPKRVPV